MVTPGETRCKLKVQVESRAGCRQLNATIPCLGLNSIQLVSESYSLLSTIWHIHTHILSAIDFAGAEPLRLSLYASLTSVHVRLLFCLIFSQASPSLFTSVRFFCSWKEISSSDISHWFAVLWAFLISILLSCRCSPSEAAELAQIQRVLFGNALISRYFYSSGLTLLTKSPDSGISRAPYRSGHLSV